MFLQMVKGQVEALITSVSKKEKQMEWPIALNTVELMRGKKGFVHSFNVNWFKVHLYCKVVLRIAVL